jgi:LacI family transcriptional regulator
MKDVADRAGVSAKTVSRVFNDDPHVLAETRDRVQAAIRELNYVPNMLARTFREGKDAVLAVAVPDLADPFFAAMIRSIEHVADGQGVALMVTGLNRDPSRERAGLEALLRRQVIGLIVCPVHDDQSYLKPWQARTPIVFVDRKPARLSADTIVEDDFGGGHQATAHLIAHGHTRIAFLGDTLALATTRLRLEGYQQALVEAGLPTPAELVSLGSVSSEEASIAVTALMRIDQPPTALLSSNARITMGVIPALQELGRERTGLISYGDFPMSTVIRPAVTVIDQDPDLLGRLAAERLFLRRDQPNKRLTRKVVLAVTLIPRGSGEIAPASPDASPESRPAALPDSAARHIA